MARRFYMMVTAFALLGACGGGSDVIDSAGGGGGAGGGGSGTLHCALTGCEIAKLPPTPIMPTGSASYIGRASITAVQSGGALHTTNADLALSANFSASTVSVALTNFVTGSTAFSGSASGTGSIDGNGFQASYRGTLTPPGGGGAGISGAMAGTFRGDGAVALNGEISITGGAESGGDAYGQFFANRN